MSRYYIIMATCLLGILLGCDNLTPTPSPTASTGSHTYELSIDGTSGASVELLLISRAADGTLDRQKVSATVPFKRSIYAHSLGVWADWLPERSGAPNEYVMTVRVDGGGASSASYKTMTDNVGSGYVGDL